MGCPIPPLFRGIDFVAVVGSLSFAGFALLRQIRRYQNKNPGTFATFLRLAALFRSMQSKNRMFHGRSPALLRHESVIRRLGTIANRKKVAARIDFLFLGSRDGFRDCAIGGMNIDVTLWAKWHGCGAGRSELGCSAGWTLGWVYGAATWNDAAPQVDIWNSAMFEFARSACLPISCTSRRVRGFQRRLRRSPLLRESRSLPRSAHRE